MQKSGKNRAPKFDRNAASVRSSDQAPAREFGRNFFARLSQDEEKRVKSFLLEKFGVNDSFWLDKVLYKKVHSVWLCSSKAWEVQEFLRCKSVGLMLLTELETLKMGKQAGHLFGPADGSVLSE